MYKRLLNPNKHHRNIMKTNTVLKLRSKYLFAHFLSIFTSLVAFSKRFVKLIVILFSVGLINSAHALSTDKQQDMEIEADTAELDDIKGITIYRGDVVVVQGSMRITGHTLTVHFDDNGDMELAVMQGTPATYRQLPDNSDAYDEAESLQMEYYALKDFVILIDKAVVIKPDGSRMTGSRIEYDTVLSQVKAKGSTTTVKNADGTKKKKDGRVKITIKKKKEKEK